MTSLSASPLMVALVPAATSVAFFFVALPAGAFADIVDRRRLLIATQVWMLLAAAVLGGLTLAGLMTDWRLLGLTFALGIGAAVMAPAWQAFAPHLVPRADLPAAIVLGGVSLNLARAVGPALGGLVVAAAAATVVFAAATAVLGTVQIVPVIAAAMLVGGGAWIAATSTVMSAAQNAAPSWVRARALAISILVLQGGIAVSTSRSTPRRSRCW